MLDAITSKNVLKTLEIDFLIDTVSCRKLSDTLRLIYYSEENDILEAIDIFATLTAAQRLLAIRYLKRF